MAGAILGAARPEDLHWPLQDRKYIERESGRLAAIAAGRQVDSFAYPDVMNWQPPVNQSDAVGEFQGRLVIAGLGWGEPVGETWTSGDSEWQWLRLNFGQTVLAKRRKPPRKISTKELPGASPQSAREVPWTLSGSPRNDPSHPRLSFEGKQKSSVEDDRRLSKGAPAVGGDGGIARDLDTLTDWVIRSDFEPQVVGRALLESISGRFPIESATSFAAIIAKALTARRKREQSRK